MLNSLRFSAYRTAMSLFTLLSFRFQAVTPLGLPGDGAVGFRPFAEVFPDMPIPGLYQASDYPEDESSRLRRIALSARLIGVVDRIAPASTPPVPEGERPFLAAVYPRLMRMASSPSRISISERLDSSSISISFLTLRMSMMSCPIFSIAQWRP